MRHSTNATTLTIAYRFTKRLVHAGVDQAVVLRTHALGRMRLSSLGGQCRPIQRGVTPACEQERSQARANASRAWHTARPIVSACGSKLG